MADATADSQKLPKAAHRRLSSHLTTQHPAESVASAERSADSLQRAVANPATATATGILALQHTYGNRAVAHAIQASLGNAPAVQRDTVTMPPMTVTSSTQPVERGVPSLETLRGRGGDPGDVTMERGEAVIRRNAPNPSQRLPFREGGWDADAIMTSLGQYDTVPGTDSDAVRCVQAVAIASRIPRGPSAVTSYLSAMILEGMMSRPMGDRERTAIRVLRQVIARIEARNATFRDLIWAQEAVHDLFYSDVSGTPQADIRRQIAPVFDLATRLEPMSVWCNNPAEVMAQANRLQPGEQLMVNTWQVVFNTAFDELSERGIEVAQGRSITVRVNGRRVRIRRIRTTRRPPHTSIDPVRDHSGGHQLLVLRDGATGQLRLFEPEVTSTGRHLEGLRPDGSNFQSYFRDDPEVGIYNYIQILGKLIPNPMLAPGALGTP